MNDSIEDACRYVEVGVREARASFSELLNKVETGNRVFVTRHGRPVAAIVKPDAASPAFPQIAIPGSTGEALQIVQSFRLSCLAEGENYRNMDILERIRASQAGLVGGILTFITFFQGRLFGMVRDGLLQIGQNEAMAESSLPEMLISDLIRFARVFGLFEDMISPRLISVLAECLWALQFGMSPTRCRNLIPVALEPSEAAAWTFLGARFADLVDVLYGSGTAEELMFRAVENPERVL